MLSKKHVLQSEIRPASLKAYVFTTGVLVCACVRRFLSKLLLLCVYMCDLRDFYELLISETSKSRSALTEIQKGVLDPPIFLLFWKLHLNETAMNAGQILKTTSWSYASCPLENKHCVFSFKAWGTSHVRLIGWPKHWTNN